MEKLYRFKQSGEKLIEKLIDDDVAMINHMVLNQGDFIPEHKTNSNVYMIVIRGTVTLKLEENDVKEYEHGSIINIPYDLMMNVSNQHEEQLEFFVLKAPSPKVFSAAQKG